jgi:hypothetical protein
MKPINGRLLEARGSPAGVRWSSSTPFRRNRAIVAAALETMFSATLSSGYDSAITCSTSLEFRPDPPNWCWSREPGEGGGRESFSAGDRGRESFSVRQGKRGNGRKRGRNLISRLTTSHPTAVRRKRGRSLISRLATSRPTTVMARPGRGSTTPEILTQSRTHRWQVSPEPRSAPSPRALRRSCRRGVRTCSGPPDRRVPQPGRERPTGIIPKPAHVRQTGAEVINQSGRGFHRQVQTAMIRVGRWGGRDSPRRSREREGRRRTGS